MAMPPSYIARLRSDTIISATPIPSGYIIHYVDTSGRTTSIETTDERLYREALAELTRAARARCEQDTFRRPVSRRMRAKRDAWPVVSFHCRAPPAKRRG